MRDTVTLVFLNSFTPTNRVYLCGANLHAIPLNYTNAAQREGKFSETQFYNGGLSYYNMRSDVLAA